jgi:hypothetical protein
VGKSQLNLDMERTDPEKTCKRCFALWTNRSLVRDCGGGAEFPGRDRRTFIGEAKNCGLMRLASVLLE